ncbi:hypothetical protein NKR19_g16 [Coniochaeta hoffmannii]|uniref:WSC domain-containing protein n=1 Tax=Coniochaeta hoffmannii TaxID=91930 RepID=A0AA38W1B9_9PEZI|nr:hypothetical protein NKR19_g16 [Coniochaeta hoffmannii]
MKNPAPDGRSPNRHHSRLRCVVSSFFVLCCGNLLHVHGMDDASKNGRTLPDKKYANDAMAIEMCASYAKALKYQYFGLEYGKECWMANVINPLAQRSLPPDNPGCTTACPGNASQLCGGRARINLYSFLPAASTSSTGSASSVSTSPTATYFTGAFTASSSSTSAAPATSAGSPSGTATPVDFTKVLLSDNAALGTGADGKPVVNLTPVAPGQASIKVPHDTLPPANPGDQIAVQVSYATMKAVKRAELAQCSLVIALGGVIIYNQIITTTDGNYTTVTVLTNYPTGATTLIITENCPVD